MAIFNLDQFPRHRPSEAQPLPFVNIFAGETTKLPSLIIHRGQPMLPRANLVEVIGQRKAGKSTAAMCWVLAILTGEYLSMSAKNDVDRILWCDTEQGETELRQRFLHSLQNVNLFTPSINERLQVLSLRCIPKTQRIDILAEAVKAFAPDLIILDGIADLAQDFNDQKECFDVLEQLSMMADKENLCIVALIHKNRADDNSKGHMGACLDQKAYQIYSVCKRDGTAEVKYIDGRGAPIEGFTFTFDENGVPIAAEQKREDERGKCLRRWTEIFSALGENDGGYTNKQIKDAVKVARNIGERQANEDIREAVGFGVLIRTGEGRNTRYALCFNDVSNDNDSEL